VSVEASRRRCRTCGEDAHTLRRQRGRLDIWHWIHCSSTFRVSASDIVKLPPRARFSLWALNARARSAGARHLLPDVQGARSQQTVVNSVEQMSADPEEVL
jgi:hypothetical protein